MLEHLKLVPSGILSPVITTKIGNIQMNVRITLDAFQKTYLLLASQEVGGDLYFTQVISKHLRLLEGAMLV